MEESKQKKLDAIIKRAEMCPNKGRLYVYEQLKQEVLKLELSSYDYEQACITIAKHLEV
jgi:hypothetical protein